MLTCIQATVHCLRTYGAIPALVNQLRRPETRVQMAVLGALRNLSFGRANDENKMEIAGRSANLHEHVLTIRNSLHGHY